MRRLLTKRLDLRGFRILSSSHPLFLLSFFLFPSPHAVQRSHPLGSFLPTYVHHHHLQYLLLSFSIDPSNAVISHIIVPTPTLLVYIRNFGLSPPTLTAVGGASR